MLMLARCRCPVCHYRYQFARPKWAALLKLPVVPLLMTAAAAVIAVSLLGFLPTYAPNPHHELRLHFLNGLVLLGAWHDARTSDRDAAALHPLWNACAVVHPAWPFQHNTHLARHPQCP